MLQRILTKEQNLILAAEREWLNKLQVALVKFEVAEEQAQILARSIRQLDELFLLVIVGEFNSGKSSFINALLGTRILAEGVTPTTRHIQLLKYGPEVKMTTGTTSLCTLTAPVELLREINIVDTPGTNAIHREHEALTREFVPRSDMVLFITSADRPFTESERQFLERIRAWGKKVALIINKIDILETEEEIKQIVDFVTANAQTLLGFSPQIFPISARQALRAKEQADAELRAASRFDALEESITATLDETERLRLKLQNPIGVGRRLIAETVQVISGRLELLTADVQVIREIEEQLASYEQEMKQDFRYRLADVDNTLHAFEQRGMNYFNETLRLARLFDLLNKRQLQEEFKRNVVANIPQVIEKQVTEIIDWLVTHDLHQWEAVMEHISERRQKHAPHIVGRVGGSFRYDRDHLLATVGNAARLTLETYDQAAEANQISIALQLAVAETALVEISALGLGALLTTLFTTTALDLTGILAAGALAALGLFIIPARRRKVKRELREKIETMRQELMSALTKQFDRELQRGLRHIQEAIAPYTRFIRTERDKLNSTKNNLEEIEEQLERLEGQIRRISG